MAKHLLSCHVQNKMVKMVQGEHFASHAEGLLCLNKTSQRNRSSKSLLHHIRGGPFFVAANVSLHSVQSKQLSLPLSRLPPCDFPHESISVPTCSKALVRS